MSAQNIPSELIRQILSYIVDTKDQLNCALTCKAWGYHAMEALWFKPNFVRTSAWASFVQVMNQHAPTYYPYTLFIRRINLTSLGTSVTDQDFACLKVCQRLERVTLIGCSTLTDAGLLELLSQDACTHLVSMDLTDVIYVSDTSIMRIAEACPKLQGLNLSMCKEGLERFNGVTDQSIIKLAQKCKTLRRIKLNNCSALTNAAAIALARHCPALLEIDLINCHITNEALYEIFACCPELREFRINQCVMISDAAFTQSVMAPPTRRMFDFLRIVDLTAVALITDDTVRQLVQSAPKIRNLILNKCPNISDEGVLAICNLGRYLHYLCLGHCERLTDFSIMQLARHCTRIRYLDLACCSQLTDRAVTQLATLPKLKRIGLVKCVNITDHSIYALTSCHRIANSLERVHLSYCQKLSVHAITQLVNYCQKLTHLSLTHVQSFLRPDIQQYCRLPPKDFNVQQRAVFCVFSGKGVRDLRAYLNTLSHTASSQASRPGSPMSLDALPSIPIPDDMEEREGFAEELV